MTTTERQAFVPNCVFIPPKAEWKDSNGRHVHSEEVQLLMLVGDNISGELFHREGWEVGMPPIAIRYCGDFLNPDHSEIEEGRIEFLPEICIVKIDEREWWLDEFVLKNTKRLYGVYVFDCRKHVHICSFEPTYELYFLGSQWETAGELSDEDSEKLFDIIQDGDADCERYTYWGVGDIDEMMEVECRECFLPPEGKNGGFVLDGLTAVTTEEALEEVDEGYHQSEF